MTAADFVGAWQLEWGGGQGTCQLARDGAYFEQWYGTSWQGTWQVVPSPPSAGAAPGITLRVTEYPLHADGGVGQPMTWSATLKPGAREGVLTDGRLFRLRPVEKTRPDA
jgi:hypothetical protein